MNNDIIITIIIASSLIILGCISFFLKKIFSPWLQCKFSNAKISIFQLIGMRLRRKTDVNGANESPVFTFLKEAAPTEAYEGLKAKATRTMLKGISKSVEKDSDILWNFTKFLVARDGVTVKRFAPVAEPKDFEKDVEALL